MFDEDFNVLFEDFGVTAVFGSLYAQVILDMPDNSIFGDSQISTDYSITYANTELSGLKHGSSITVDGTAYTVREVEKLDDGRLLKASIKR